LKRSKRRYFLKPSVGNKEYILSNCENELRAVRFAKAKEPNYQECCVPTSQYS